MVWFDLHTINTLKLSTERTIKPMNGFWTKFAFWVAIVVVVVVYADIHTIQVRIHSIGIYKFKFNGHTVVHQNFCYSYVFFVLRFSFKQFKVKIFQRIPLKCSNAIVGIDEYVCILCVCVCVLFSVTSTHQNVQWIADFDKFITRLVFFLVLFDSIPCQR